MRTRAVVMLGLVIGSAFVGKAAGQAHEPAKENPPGEDVRVIVRQVEEQGFPRITLDFEVKRADDSAILDAKKEEFEVREYGEPVAIESFRSPISREFRPTTVVLVLDRSGSMNEEHRMRSLKRAVTAFLEQQPAGSRVAVIAFGSEADLICPFTEDRGRVQSAVDELRPFGSTRFYDAVVAALEQIGEENGRRAVVAMTDGADTSSRQADLDEAIRVARRAGLPVHTVGVGSEDQIRSDDLRLLAEETRGQYFPARDADQLRGIYEEIVRSLKQSYTLTYRSNRTLPDGTLRPITIRYRTSPSTAGEAAVYIPGMVVPSRGWSPLFVGLVALLGALMILPAARRRAVVDPRPGRP